MINKCTSQLATRLRFPYPYSLHKMQRRLQFPYPITINKKLINPIISMIIGIFHD